jgi:ParB/RepB/Spo0J family partition protein
VEAFRRIPVAQIDEPRNPVRTMFDEDAMNELCRSIRDNGLIEPLVVFPVDGDRVEVMAGHRRLLAARIVGLLELPCLVRESADQVDAVQIAENADREEMSPADEGRRYVRLYDQNGRDVDAVCALVKRGRARVEGRMLLLAGDPKVLEALEGGEITLGVAEELNAFKRPEGRDFHLGFAIRCGASRAQVRDWRVRDNQMAVDVAAAPPVDPTTAAPAAPAPTLETPYAAMARPHEISSSLEPRPCMFCGETFQEYRMFRKYVCAEDAQKYLVPLEQAAARATS